jgi:uncharacterized protein
MGTLLRLVIVLIAIWLVLRIVRRYLADRGTPPPASGPRSPADMLRCDYCGMFVPRAEAVRAGDKHYCSRQHAQAARRNE